jgi:hypothetical protein
LALLRSDLIDLYSITLDRKVRARTAYLCLFDELDCFSLEPGWLNDPVPVQAGETVSMA